MNLLAPVALWGLATVPLIVILYVLRPRHRRLTVPSIRLWRQLPSDLEGRPRWRLPVSSLLLLLQLLIAAGVALALARPSLPGTIREHLIVLLDTSPTMAATDVLPNRLAEAVNATRGLASAVGSEDLVTLISIEPNPRVLADGKGSAALNSALTSVTLAPERGDVVSAILLASQTAQLSRDTHNRIVVVSDGTFGSVSLHDIGEIPADVTYQQIGGGDNNQGVTALSVRPMIGSANRFVGFVQIANYAHQDTQISFQALADGIQLDREQFPIAARGHVELSLPLPAGTRHLAVAIDRPDAYAPDNQAEVLVPDAQPVSVTLVGADSAYWERAFRTLSTVALSVVPPGEYKPNNAAITVFDQFIPSALPAGNVVLVAPPKGNSFVNVTGEINGADIVHLDGETPLFDSIDLAGLFVPRLVTYGAIPWATVLADTSRGPAVLDGVQNGRRMVVIGFDPGETDWPQRPSFPVFVANLVENMVSVPIPADVAPGAVLDLPPTAGATSVLVQLPNNKVDLFDLSDRPIRFTDTSQLGSYAVTYANGSSPVARQEFVVNRLGLAESNILPTVDPSQLTQLGSPVGQQSEHEIWTWVAAGALALLGVEWLAYFSRHAT